MIGYTTLGTNDLPRAAAFFDALFTPLGYKQLFKSERSVGWGLSFDQPSFSVMKPFDGKPATVGNGVMIALTVANPEQVHAMHDQALALGGVDEGLPGPRGNNFYGAYFRDLDGNKLCVFCITA